MKTWQRIKENPELLEKYAQRATIVKAVRDFFWEQKFLEVETPQLVPVPSMEPYLEVFETTLIDEAREQYRAFLTSSPEFAMKKLLAAGYENVFQICKSYRNQEGWSTRHNPEFTILEWYRSHADYTQIMEDCENLFRFVAKRIGYANEKMKFDEPWERISIAQSFEKYADIDTETLLNHEALKKRAGEKGYNIEPSTTWEEAFNQIFLNEIEPHLGSSGKPTILFDYPAEMAALSKRSEKDPRFAERFEFYINGLEMGNAFSELTDPDEQLKRLTADREEKRQLGRTLFDVDLELIEALRSGMPRTGGIAVGMDRLCMVFMGVSSIQETLFFPATEMWDHR
jgi:lysyl-tRNA synthetase class 2